MTLPQKKPNLLCSTLKWLVMSRPLYSLSWKAPTQQHRLARSTSPLLIVPTLCKQWLVATILTLKPQIPCDLTDQEHI